MWNNSLYGCFRSRTFSQIFEDADTFVNEYADYENAIGNLNKLKNESITALFYLLYAKYGNWSIGNSDENQFKFKVWSTIFEYGPTWEKRLEIQKDLRNLTEEDLLKGATQITNHSFDPGTAPSTIDTDELDTVNDQNVNKYKRSKLDAYQYLDGMLKTDVTKEFINRFKGLFNPFAQPQLPLWYVSEDDHD